MLSPSLNPGAVFLSYAREDTDAARRIADALRGFGVEVWFDQAELRGGDAWDAKIRKQIRECALFVAVVSAHTQARGEGYFRLEWKLAVERTHLMAEGVPFLAPVAVDDTPDSAAVVPAEFLRVQWTRLPGGLPTPEFVAQVKRLLDAPSQCTPAKKTANVGPPVPNPLGGGKRGFARWIAAGLSAGAIGLIGFVALRPGAPPSVATKSGGGEPAAAHAGLADAPGNRSIAVIPFENRSAEKDNAYFTDGIHDDILTSLSNLHELRVISRTSVMEYRGTTKKIPQIARELGVAYVLEGGVQRVGNSVHITGQLIRAATDEHVWAKSFDRELTAANIFAIQSELAQAIAGELKAAISPQEKTQLDRAATTSLAAYELYAKGRQIFYARGNDIETMFKEVTPLYQRAVELDPNFADAWAGVSVAYSLAYNRGIERTPESKAKARDAIQTALRLAPEKPGVILTLARYYAIVEGDYVRALVESERAARLSPNNADLYDTLVSIYNRQGRAAEALAASRQAHALNPRSASLARGLGVQLINARRYAEAEAVLRQALELQPDLIEAEALLAALPLFTRGSTREWDAWLQSVPAVSRTNGTFQTLHLQVTAAKGNAADYVELVSRYRREAREGFGYALALILTGQTERARTVAATIRDEQRANVARDPTDAVAWNRLAFAYAALGERAAAGDAADKSLALRSNSPDQTVPPSLVRMRHAQLLAWIDRKDLALQELGQVWWEPILGRDPLTSFMWAPLKGDPRFEALKQDPRNTQPLY
jgi:TolB-like protein/Tfp pilus assembly protein PilF